MFTSVRGILLTVFSLISLFVMTEVGMAAEIIFVPGRIEGKTAQHPVIRLSGRIDDDTVVDFSHYAALADSNAKKLGFVIYGQPHGLVSVEVDSFGGNMVAGLELGQKVREMGFGVKIPKGAICASACVYILAGGVTRNVEGRVGIHRPYLNDDDLITMEQQRTRYKRIEKVNTAFYESVNISPSLYERQLRIPGNEIVWLSLSEMQIYGLNQNDPYYYEAVTAALAKSLGTTKGELVNTLTMIEKICNNPKTSFACAQRVIADRHRKTP